MEEINKVELEKASGYLCTVEVREQCVPHYEIDLPYNVIKALGLMEDDTIRFIEENSRVYIEKA